MISIRHGAIYRQITAAASVLAFSGLAAAQGIYSCTDASGRRITADRPIAECTDRVQRELSKTGTVTREIGPTLTAQERAMAEEKERLMREAAAREVDTRRRDRALLLRYPTRKVHDQERQGALAQVDEVIQASNKRTEQLAEQRARINTELEFYLIDPSKTPVALKRRIEENNKSVSVQKTFVDEQDQEKKRINLRFDEELVKLKPLWALAGGPAGTVTSAQKNAARP